MNDNINMDSTISWSVHSFFWSIVCTDHDIVLPMFMLSFIFLINSMYWPWYCTVHVYVVILFWKMNDNINMDSTVSWSVHTIYQKNEWQHKHGQYNIMVSTYYISDIVLSMFMLSFIFLIYSMYWPWYCTVHVYVVIHFSDL
jgi:hypothetical protein